MKKSIITLLSVLAIALMLVGCGGSEGSTGSSSVEAPADNAGDSVATQTPAGTGTQNTDNDVAVDATLESSKKSIEEIFGAVPANPGAA